MKYKEMYNIVAISVPADGLAPLCVRAPIGTVVTRIQYTYEVGN